MTRGEFKEKIRLLVVKILKDKKDAEASFAEYDELTKFPELKDIIVTLLTSDFDPFLAGIDWVAPRPTTFRINLRNDQEFYLIYSPRSWVAQIEGKKYYLLNLSEEERACEAIARILRYGSPDSGEEESADMDTGADASADTGGGEEVDITIDDTVDVEA